MDTSLESGGTFVWFGLSRGEQGSAAIPYGTLSEPVVTKDRASFEADSIRVAVQAPADLRRQIMATAHLNSGTDHNGCAAVSPFASDPQWRPTGEPVTALTDVQAVAACSYSGGHLVSSLRLEGDLAVSSMQAVGAAPVGSGPNSPPGQCLADDLSAVEHLLLQVTSAKTSTTSPAPTTVVVRYGGCFHRSLDDGTTRRLLTRDAVIPFVVGPNEVRAWSGEELSDIVRP